MTTLPPWSEGAVTVVVMLKDMNLTHWLLQERVTILPQKGFSCMTMTQFSVSVFVSAAQVKCIDMFRDFPGWNGLLFLFPLMDALDTQP